MRYLLPLIFISNLFSAEVPSLPIDTPRTLPKGFYQPMGTPTRKGCYFYKDPSFSSKNGFQWSGKIQWLASSRVTDFHTHLTQGLNTLQDPNSEYRLKVTVVRAELDYTYRGDFAVEFEIRDKEDFLLAAFHISTYTIRYSGSEAYKQVSDEILTYFERDFK